MLYVLVMENVIQDVGGSVDEANPLELTVHPRASADQQMSNKKENERVLIVIESPPENRSD